MSQKTMHTEIEIRRSLYTKMGVFLLIFFLITLLIMVFLWGPTFVADIEEAYPIICSPSVDIKIRNVCETTTNGTYKVTISNDGDFNLDGVQIYFYKSLDDVNSKQFYFEKDGVPGINVFDIESDEQPSGYLGGGEVYQVEAVPIRIIRGKINRCRHTIQTFGSLVNSLPIKKCS